MVWVRVSVVVDFPLVPVDGEGWLLSFCALHRGQLGPQPHFSSLGSCSPILSSSFG